MVKPNDPVGKFESMMEARDDDSDKSEFLKSLVKLFFMLHEQNDFMTAYPEFHSLFAGLNRHLDREAPDVVEDHIAQLYCYLHGKDSAYSSSDRREFDDFGGYWCHAGGLSPLLRAKPYITPQTRLADYGAGNGLQGLLFQYLYPHQKTCQIELGGPMIKKGKRLQTFMGIPEEKVEWIHKNVIDVPPDLFDFIYIYRPVRPEGRGKIFYEEFANRLDRVEHGVTIFSIADCLKDFLPPRYQIFYDDGHLTCFSNESLV